MNKSIMELYRRIDTKKLKECLLYMFIFGLIAHGFCYFNLDVSHDSLFSLYEESPEHMLSIGRYFRPIYRVVRGNLTLPTLIGFLSLLFFGLASYFLIDTLKINNKIFRIITCGILITNFSISLLNATYLHDADSYGLSLLLVCFGVWVSLKYDKGIRIATLLFFISLGIYQAYINVAIYMFMIVSIINLLNGEEYKKELKILAKEFIAIITSMIMYYIGYKVSILVTGVNTSNAYNSMSRLLTLNIDSILDRVYHLASSEYGWFFTPHNHNVNIIVVINFISVLLGLIIVYFYFAESAIKKENKILSSIIIMLIPIGMNTMTIISNSCHNLTIYSFFISYIFIIVLYENYEKNVKKKLWLKKTIILILSLMIFDNCIYSNETYLKKHLEFNTTLSTFTRIIDRMEQLDGYEVGKTKVVIIGSLQNSNLSFMKEAFDYKGTGLTEKFSTTYYKTYEKYLNYVLGYPIVLLNENEANKMKTDKTIIAMDVFPGNGSIAFVNDVVVVKLSN